MPSTCCAESRFLSGTRLDSTGVRKGPAAVVGVLTTLGPGRATGVIWDSHEVFVRLSWNVNPGVRESYVRLMIKHKEPSFPGNSPGEGKGRDWKGSQ